MIIRAKKNKLKQFWLKLTNRKKYLNYKNKYRFYQQQERINELVKTRKAFTIFQLLNNVNKKDHINFIHSGNAGDIVYALPVIKKVFELTGKACNLYLKLNEPIILDPSYTHPLGSVMLNEKMVNLLKPLINVQPYINNCKAFNGTDEIDIDLDSFRLAGMYLDRGNIARWNFYTTGVTANLTAPWLSVEPNTKYANTIVVARSSRYNNPLISFSFLSKYDKVLFVGVESEFKTLKASVSNLQWLPVNNFLELASIIAGCKVFIGNQSFPFSIAEALKASRILEVFFPAPNVVPEGENGHDFLFQEHFEYLVRTLTQ